VDALTSGENRQWAVHVEANPALEKLFGHWRQLLDRTWPGFAELERQGKPAPNWVLGGGQPS
jgi:hypothetical protein